MDLFKYEYILTVAEEQSFTKAAEKLFIAQPSLSQYVKSVEKKIGAELFNRSVTPIQLTSAGKLFVEAGRKIVHQQNQLLNQIADVANLSVSRLSVGFTPFRSTCILPQVVTAFRRLYPNVDISVMTGVTPRLMQASREGKLDIFTANVPSLNKTQYRYSHICDERILLAVPVEHPLNQRFASYRVPMTAVVENNYRSVPSIPLLHFRDEPFLQSAHPQDLHTFFDDICRTAGFVPNVLMQSENIESIFSMTIAGLGLSFIPCSYIRFGNIARHAAYYCVDSALREFAIAYGRDVYLSTAAKAFIAILTSIMN